ncbi:ACT domain-containing protein [Nioella sp. MMSF_3534]|uniref:ACT domain-containing protein n=1 Tax=Nioella sp. MMSF_3534 TaxID=3046720 RepID=UPI003531E03D
MAPVRDRGAMIRGMAPVLDPSTWHFGTVTDVSVIAGTSPLATFVEEEGLSLILSEADATASGLPTDMPMARITLTVHSALDGVGLTAAVATALADAGIPCNMVAAFHHDHAFVPLADAPRALAILKALADAEGAA